MLATITRNPMMTAEQLVAEACTLKQRYGFTVHKLKGGVFKPEYELASYRALAEALEGDTFRFDPNGAWSVEQAIWFGQFQRNIGMLGKLNCS